MELHRPWWEYVVAPTTDLATALDAAIQRGIDVDEDTGAAPVCCLPTLAGQATDLYAMTAARAGLNLRAGARTWEVTTNPTVIGRSARGLLSELTDMAESLLAPTCAAESSPVHLVLHAVGPWSFGATVEHGGHSLLGDRPAFKDIAVALGEGLADQAAHLHSITGAQVFVVLHEPHVAAVQEGLPGPTRWDTLPPEDQQFIYGVWHRFVTQLGNTPVILHRAEQTLLTIDAAAIGFHTMGVDTLTPTDHVAHLIQARQRVAFILDEEFPTAGGLRDIDLAAGKITSQIHSTWRAWSFPEEELVTRVGVANKESTAPATQAATLRTVAANLARG